MMFGRGERARVVELYFITATTTAQVVEYLGHPTRQCPECWLAADSLYASHLVKSVIALETRRKAIELVPGGIQQKQTVSELGVSICAAHNWIGTYREGGMAALTVENRNAVTETDTGVVFGERW